MNPISSSSSNAVLPPSLSQRYEVLDEPTQAPDSRICHCQDGFSHREVALRLANPDVFDGDAGARKAWLNEIRIVSSLEHPYVAAVYDAGFADGRPYVAAEYFPAGSLAGILRPGRLRPAAEALEIIHKCASALDYARQAGVIHRRLRPENIFYSGQGAAKVANFGCVYWEGKAAHIHLADVLRYRAPEALNGQGSMAADIYALGIVLHQLLTGACPYESGDADLLRQRIQAGERKPLTAWRNDLPQGFEPLLDRMLAVSLEVRYKNWGEVLAGIAETAVRIGRQTADALEPSQAAVYDGLRALPLLKSLDDAQLWELLRISHWRNVPAGTTVIREGSEARSCYLLLSGEAKVTREGKLIAMFDPGVLFGEMAFAEDPPERRAATVVTASPAAIGKWSYSNLLKATPGLQSRMMEIFFRLAVARLKQSDERYLRLYRKLNSPDT